MVHLNKDVKKAFDTLKESRDILNKIVKKISKRKANYKTDKIQRQKSPIFLTK